MAKENSKPILTLTISTCAAIAATKEVTETAKKKSKRKSKIKKEKVKF